MQEAADSTKRDKEPTIENGISVAFLKKLVTESTELQVEFSIKVLKKPGKSVTTTISREHAGRVSPFSTFYSTARSPQETCLSSHTHYRLDSESYDQKLPIFLSDGDLVSIFLGSPDEQNEHLGSFFVPNPFGITFVVNAELFDKEKIRTQSTYWIDKNKESKLGWIDHLNTSTINTDEKMSFSAYSYIYGIVLDLVFIPYEELSTLHIDLEEVLFGQDLSKIVAGTVFEAEIKKNNFTSIIDVIHKTKSCVSRVLASASLKGPAYE